MAGRFSVEAVFKAVDHVTAPVRRMQSSVGKFTRSTSRGLHKVNRVLDKVTGGLARGAKTAAKFAVAGIGLATAAVTLFVREFSKIENAEAAFTPLLGGAKKAKEAIAALNETAASTPFQFETLASAANQLLPVMNQNIERTIKTVRMLGDTAGGNAQKLDSITRGFTKAMLKGKVDMESLNMIAEAGVPIFTELADSMGVKVNKAFFKMITAGDVTTKHLTTAFEKMTNSGGIFFGGMEIASKTTTGLLSTLKDNVSLTAAEIGGVLAPTIKDLIRGVTRIAVQVRAWVKNNRELINDTFLAFVARVKELVKQLTVAIEEFGGTEAVFARMLTVVDGVVGAFQFLGEHGATILKVTAAVVGLAIVMKTLAAVLAVVNLVMAANPITLIVLGVLALTAALVGLVMWLNKTDGVFSKVGKGFDKFKSFVGFGGDDSDGQSAPGTAPQVVSPADRIARQVNEQRTTSTAEVTLRDETGRAEVTGGALGPGVELLKTGSF